MSSESQLRALTRVTANVSPEIELISPSAQSGRFNQFADAMLGELNSYFAVRPF
jgi:hypothetical protein